MSPKKDQQQPDQAGQSSQPSMVSIMAVINSLTITINSLTTTVNSNDEDLKAGMAVLEENSRPSTPTGQIRSPRATSQPQSITVQQTIAELDKRWRPEEIG